MKNSDNYVSLAERLQAHIESDSNGHSDLVGRAVMFVSNYPPMEAVHVIGDVGHTHHLETWEQHKTATYVHTICGAESPFERCQLRSSETQATCSYCLLQIVDPGYGDDDDDYVVNRSSCKKLDKACRVTDDEGVTHVFRRVGTFAWLFCGISASALSKFTPRKKAGITCLACLTAYDGLKQRR